MQNGVKRSMKIQRERFCVFDLGSKVALAVELVDGRRFSVRMDSDGELPPDLTRYHVRLRGLMRDELDEVSG